MISFILNEKIVETDLPNGSTVLDYIRYEKQLMGTKIGCREGDCGACTVLIGDLKDEGMQYQSMTSCLTPLGNVQGKHVLTVEGISTVQRLSPVQDLMVTNNGTQCGFCTIGFVMSLTGYVLSDESPSYENAIKSIDGNICRCTGYKSIERAAQELSDLLKERPKENALLWLAENGYVADYMTEIPAKLQSIKNTNGLASANGKASDFLMGGGTDLMVQKPELIRKLNTQNIFDDPTLKGIKTEGNEIIIGASTTVTEFGESPIIRKIFPKLDGYLKLVSSTPIRNMATLGGNLVNASPIGDMTIFFLGLNSSVVLTNGTSNRTLLLKDLFLDYKKLDRTTDEWIESIQFTVPERSSYFNFEKVSKRTHLDIASVNSACQLVMNDDDTIAEAHISAGGVSAIPKYLHKSSAFLKHKQLDHESLSAFLDVLYSEISPISDARGTAAYKKLLLRQLVLSHFMTFFGPIDSIKKVLQEN